MKRIGTIKNEQGQTTGLIHGPDVINQSINVDGKVWRFDFCKWTGPLWLKSDGWSERKCQNPSKKVWDAFEKWHQNYKSMKGKCHD